MALIGISFLKCFPFHTGPRDEFQYLIDDGHRGGDPPVGAISYSAVSMEEREVMHISN